MGAGVETSSKLEARGAVAGPRRRANAAPGVLDRDRKLAAPPVVSRRWRDAHQAVQSGA